MLALSSRAPAFSRQLLAALNPAAAADAAAGKTKAAKCRLCHGLDGLAKNPDAPNLAGDNANYIRQAARTPTGAANARTRR